MTAAKKTAGFTLAGLVAAVILAGTAWPTIEKVLNWLGPILAYPWVQAVALGWAAGAFTLPLPWAMPAQLARFWTLTCSAAFAFVVAAGTTFLLLYADGEPAANRRALVYAFAMAGMGSIAWNSGIRALYLHLRPMAEPKSLQP